MLGNEASTEKESIGSELLTRLERITSHLTETTERLEVRLAKVSASATPACEDVDKNAVREYPAYFNHFREQLDRLENVNTRISGAIDRCEI